MAANPDGSNTLARDSAFGVATTFIVYALVDAGITMLTHLNTDTWEGWWARLAQAAVATGLGLLTAYKARRSSRSQPFRN